MTYTLAWLTNDFSNNQILQDCAKYVSAARNHLLPRMAVICVRLRPKVLASWGMVVFIVRLR